jgi:hypothetical protein
MKNQHSQKYLDLKKNCIPQIMNIDRGVSGCNASRTNMDAPTKNFNTDVKCKSEGNI